MVRGYDGSVIKIREDGEIVIVSAKDRHELANDNSYAEKEENEDKPWMAPSKNSYFS